MAAETLVYALLAFCGLASTVSVYLAVTEKDLVKAVIYSAAQSGLYAVAYFLLMAPDVVLVYLPVALGLVPAILLSLISKTERWEGG